MDCMPIEKFLTDLGSMISPLATHPWGLLRRKIQFIKHWSKFLA